MWIVRLQIVNVTLPPCTRSDSMQLSFHRLQYDFTLLPLNFLPEHVVQSKACLSYLQFVVFLHAELFVEFLVVNLATSVKSIIFSEQTFHTTSTKVLQHVNLQKVLKLSHPWLLEKWLQRGWMVVEYALTNNVSSHGW